MFCDSDEIIEADTSRQTLAEAIGEADAEGANLMQCDRFDFFMSTADVMDFDLYPEHFTLDRVHPSFEGSGAMGQMVADVISTH